MKRLLAYFMTLAAVAAIATACPPPDTPPEPKPDSLKLTGKIENMLSGGPYTLRVVSYDTGDGETLLASTPISVDGSFTVDIPGSIDSQYLIPYNESSDWTYGLPHDGVTVSNGGVKFSATYLEVYSGEEYIDDVWYGKEEDNIYVVGFLFFANGDCEITGSYYNRGVGADAIYDLSIGKGWNWAYGTEIEGSNGDNDEIRIESVAPAGLRIQLYD